MTATEINDLLTAARTAYHTLVTGGALRVYVDQNGERAEFSVARSTDLLAYIRSLEEQLALLTANSRRYRPLTPFF